MSEDKRLMVRVPTQLVPRVEEAIARTLDLHPWVSNAKTATVQRLLYLGLEADEARAQGNDDDEDEP